MVAVLAEVERMPVLRVRYSKDQVHHRLLSRRLDTLREYAGSVGDCVSHGSSELPEQWPQPLFYRVVDEHVLV